MEKITTEKARELKLKEYKRGKVWKQFFKQKVYELGIVPLGLITLIFVPYGLGKVVFDGFHLNWTDVCNGFADNSIIESCKGSTHNFDYWFFGLMILVIVGAFIYGNWCYASEKIEKDFDSNGNNK